MLLLVSRNIRIKMRYPKAQLYCVFFASVK